MGVRLEKWRAEWGSLDEAAMRRRLEAEGYAVSRYVYAPGTCFPDHTHAVNKKDTVRRGRLKITFEGQEIILEPGDMLEIPAGTRHTAEVVGEEAVVSFDATRLHPPGSPRQGSGQVRGQARSPARNP